MQKFGDLAVVGCQTRGMSDVASLLVGRSFRIAAIAGVPTLDSPVADVRFGRDGQVTGRGTVNRFFGPYAIDGEALTLGPLAATLMAGPPEAMDQEQRLHRALSHPLTAAPAEDGRRIELCDGGDVVLLLVPVDDEELL
jgi:heat shock protein HslJ